MVWADWGALGMFDTYTLHPCSCLHPKAGHHSALVCPGCGGVPLRRRDLLECCDLPVCTEKECALEGRPYVWFYDNAWMCRGPFCPSNGGAPPTFPVRHYRTDAEPELGNGGKRRREEDGDNVPLAQLEERLRLKKARLDGAHLRQDNYLLKRQVRDLTQKTHLRALQADRLLSRTREMGVELEEKDVALNKVQRKLEEKDALLARAYAELGTKSTLR